eukprot:TRINITY_DN5275_c0_g1_i1.p1 TRINITY_DN5275_c0_g1~~TRINITY_DN5275_c0_g1_i1.p1  ORF type:complete len:120 (-),score=23.77 TRINITY_DN5275_c0_g1_i1:164-481(-)
MSAKNISRVVDDFDPFSTIHRRAERFIAPKVRTPHLIWMTLIAAILSSAATQRFFRRTMPITMTEEWKKKEKEIDAGNFAHAITNHKVGEPITIPEQINKMDDDE